MLLRPHSRFLTEWVLLTLGLLLVGLVVGMSMYKEYGNIDRSERERLATQASVIDKNLSRALLVVDRTLLGVRDDLPGWLAEKDGMARASHRLAAFAKAMRSVRTLLILDAGGQAVAASHPKLLGLDLSQRPYFQIARAQTDPNVLYVSPPFETALGIWAMNVARVIPGPAGEFAGIISATLDPDELRVQLGAVLYGQDMWAALAHGDGLQVVMEPDGAGQAGRNLAQPGSFFTRHLNSGQSAEVLEDSLASTGEHRLVALHTIRPADLPMDKPLVVAIGRETGALYVAWWQQAWLEGGLFLLLAGLSVPGLALTQRRRRREEGQKEQIAVVLAEKERFMRSLIDIIPGMVGYWDADLRCGFSNIAYREWFGKTPEQMQGIRIQDLMGEVLFKKNEPFMRLALAGQHQDFERTLVKPDGSTGYTWAHYIPDVADGRVRGFFVLVSDVTELKQAQVQLEIVNAALEKRSVEAEAASRAKSAFVANMSHEIRTPMNAVLGLLELLQHTALDNRQIDYVHKAEGAAKSLLAILNDILDFSKVEAGKLVLDDTPFRLDKLLRNLSVLLSAALRDRPLEILFDIDVRVPRALRGDVLRLQQVLLNLAGNAVKFTERGEVVISLRQVEATAVSVRIEFAIRDTGIGIPADRLGAVFEGFTQAENSTTRRYGGTGLGLAISQRLVRLMGGELVVDSTPGVGSCFHFQLEFQQDAETCATAEIVRRDSDPSRLPKPPRVLIIDDNPTAREVLAQATKSFAWPTETSASGEEGLERIRAAAAAGQPFDIICLDWLMPGLDGWETAEQIRAIEREDLRESVLLMVTSQGREMLEQRIAGGASPIDGFLVKPVTPSMLFDAVAVASGGESVTADDWGQALPAGRPLANLRLLLVEDNLLNQQVAGELLTHAGAWVSVAANGLQAITATRSAGAAFDAVLMDIQMPEMDGYEATRRLRADGFTAPIIAMTANALPTDRDACLAAGMNDHIGKPIDSRELVKTLLRHCGREASSVAPCAEEAPLPEVPAGFELRSAVARLNGDRRLYGQLAGNFAADQGDAVLRIEQALYRGDRDLVLRELHTLRGLAATLGAQALASLAGEMEAAIRKGGRAGSEHYLDDLRKLLAETCEILQGLAVAFASPTATAASLPASPARVGDLLEALVALLTDRNMRALDVFATLKSEVGSDLDEPFSALDGAMQGLDFVAALDWANAIRKDFEK